MSCEGDDIPMNATLPTTPGSLNPAASSEQHSGTIDNLKPVPEPLATKNSHSDDIEEGDSDTVIGTDRDGLDATSPVCTALEMLYLHIYQPDILVDPNCPRDERLRGIFKSVARTLPASDQNILCSLPTEFCDRKIPHNLTDDEKQTVRSVYRAMIGREISIFEMNKLITNAWVSLSCPLNCHQNAHGMIRNLWKN
jgi:hypothetical protein